MFIASKCLIRNHQVELDWPPSSYIWQMWNLEVSQCMTFHQICKDKKMFWWNVFLGRTVFPGLNISVLPQRGSALLWITVLRYKKWSIGQKKMKRNFFKVRPEEQYDTRMFHMGCPVARCQAIYCCASKERLWLQFFFPYLSMKPDSNNVVLLQGQQMGSHQVGVLPPTDVDSALPSW